MLLLAPCRPTLRDLLPFMMANTKNSKSTNSNPSCTAASSYYFDSNVKTLTNRVQLRGLTRQAPSRPSMSGGVARIRSATKGLNGLGRFQS